MFIFIFNFTFMFILHNVARTWIDMDMDTDTDTKRNSNMDTDMDVRIWYATYVMSDSTPHKTDIAGSDIKLSTYDLVHHRYQSDNLPVNADGSNCCSVSRWRPHKVDKRMVLEYTHGLFIT